MATNEVIVRIISFILVIALLYVGYRIFFSIKKRQFEQQRTIALCPKCGSLNQKMRDFWIAPFGPARFGCEDCNYQGVFVEVDKEKIQEFRNKIKKKRPKKKKSRKLRSKKK